MSRPSVLLPEPDSPTKPSVSPSWMSRETSSTARTSPERRAAERGFGKIENLGQVADFKQGTGESISE